MLNLVSAAAPTDPNTAPLPLIRAQGHDLVLADSGQRFVAWGFNYDHDDAGRLLEDYWHDRVADASSRTSAK